MTSQRLIDIARSENYPLKIYNASNNNCLSIAVSTELIKIITAVYRYIEPSHLNGRLIIFKRFNNEALLSRDSSSLVYNMDDLTHINVKNIIIESSNEQLYLWKDIKNTNFLKDANTVFYNYENNKEYFYVNKQKIEIPHFFECSSIYALHYYYLNDALTQYKNEKISTSNCAIFKECWYDPMRIFFKASPEKKMQESLKEFLSSALRGVEVVREYTLGASKPVDIRVKWTEANKSSLIEVKWLGKSKDERGKITANYSDSKANDGVKQLKDYLDMDNTDTPNIISKAYLIVIDGRRKGINENTETISFEKGMTYKNREIIFTERNKYFERMKNFEKPFRMFAEPIIS
jgi:hypothetical protein